MSTIGPVPAVAANGANIPLLGLGTWDLRGRSCARVVEQALRLGYTHIDTAEMYDNEREVGEGLRASGVKRDDVFVTTKIWPNHFAPRDLERARARCLAGLRFGEVDLLLLHWPNPQVPLADTIGALCKVKRDGLGAPRRRLQLHCGAGRDALDGQHRTAGLRSGRMSSVLGPVEVDCGLPQHGMALVAYSPLARGDFRRTRC